MIPDVISEVLFEANVEFQPSQNEDCLLATTLNFSIVLNFNKPERCRAQQTIATSRIHSNESLPTLPVDLHSINSSLSLRRNKYLASVASHVRRQVGWRLIYSTRAASYQLPTPLLLLTPAPWKHLHLHLWRELLTACWGFKGRVTTSHYRLWPTHLYRQQPDGCGSRGVRLSSYSGIMRPQTNHCVSRQRSVRDRPLSLSPSAIWCAIVELLGR